MPHQSRQRIVVIDCKTTELTEAARLRREQAGLFWCVGALHLYFLHAGQKAS